MLSTAALLRIFWLCCFAVPLRSAESKKGRQLDPCGHLKVHIYLDLPRPSWIDNKATHDLADPRARGGALQEVGNASYLGVPCNVVASKALYDCPRMQYLGNGSPMDPAQTGVAFQRLWDTSNYAMPWFWTRYIFNNCWAKDPKDADLFYVALPIGELHPRTKVKAGWPSSRAQYVGYIEQVKEALRAKPSWQRCQGCDHFMVLGRWTSRFRDNEAKKYGSYRNRDIFWARVMKISYEGPAHPSLINTARPSVFHPKTDAEVDRWMQFVFSRERTRTATLIVRTRPWREKLINMCEKDDSCHLPDAERYYPRYDFSVAEYLNHTFSIHPGGEGCTRKAFFDSLICGCIPIVFSGVALQKENPMMAGPPDQQYLPSYLSFFSNDPGWLQKIAISVETEEDVFRALEEITDETIELMRSNIRRVFARLLYWDTSFKASSGEASNYGPRNAIAHTLRLMKRRQRDERLYLTPSAL